MCFVAIVPQYKIAKILVEKNFFQGIFVFFLAPVSDNNNIAVGAMK